jgi:hypothetical protein
MDLTFPYQIDLGAERVRGRGREGGSKGWVQGMERVRVREKYPLSEKK